MRHVRLIAGITVLMAMIVFLPRYILLRIPLVEPIVETLNPMQVAQISIAAEMNRTLISLSTLVIGAVGILMLNFRKLGILENAEKNLALATFLFAAISISLGFVSYEVLTWMLKVGFFNLDADVVSWSGRYQYYSFILSVAALGAFLLHGIRKV